MTRPKILARETHAARFRRYVADGLPLHLVPRVLARIEASKRLPDYHGRPNPRLVRNGAK